MLKPHAEDVNDRAKLAMHRIVARRIASDSALLEIAITRMQSANPEIGYVREWLDILSLSLPDIRHKLTQRSETMTRLRISSPFMTLVDFKDEGLRRRIWRGSRNALSRRAKRMSTTLNV
jgi:hypothetical protein